MKPRLATIEINAKTSIKKAHLIRIFDAYCDTMPDLERTEHTRVIPHGERFCLGYRVTSKKAKPHARRAR